MSLRVEAAKMRKLSQIGPPDALKGACPVREGLGENRHPKDARRPHSTSFKGAPFPQDMILMGVRWYVAYPLSYRHVEEFMEERGVPVDHATIQRWVVKYSPLLEEAFHRRKRPVWVSWRMDETYIKVKGQWYYFYRAVDKHGQTIDFLLTEHRDTEAALRFLKKAIRRNG